MYTICPSYPYSYLPLFSSHEILPSMTCPVLTYCTSTFPSLALLSPEVFHNLSIITPHIHFNILNIQSIFDFNIRIYKLLQTNRAVKACNKSVVILYNTDNSKHYISNLIVNTSRHNRMGSVLHVPREFRNIYNFGATGPVPRNHHDSGDDYVVKRLINNNIREVIKINKYKHPTIAY